MNIRIIDVKNKGDIDRERVVLLVSANDDVGHYLILDTTYDGDNVSNKVQHPCWIPDAPVRKGDLVVIYTKSGVDKAIRNKDGSDTHFFYRGLDKSIWNKDGDCAILMDIREWAMKPIVSNE